MLDSSRTFKCSVSGVRGIFGVDIHPSNITVFIRAFHHVIPSGSIAVARDSRCTGPAIGNIVIGVLMALGREVCDAGIIPTPTLKAFVNAKNLAGGIMISASHNPINFTAFKFIKEQGHFFSEDDNQRWVDHVNRTDLGWGNYEQQGNVLDVHEEAKKIHIQDIIQKRYAVSPIQLTGKVAIDAMGGAGTYIIPELLDSLDISYISMYNEFYDKFPRMPEPIPSNLSEFCKFVQDNQCVIGLAYDPDADRMSVVSNEGKAIGEEWTLSLSLYQILKYREGDVVANLSSSWINRWIAEKYDKKLHQTKVGEAHVLDTMQQKGAVFGGEGNGGVIDPSSLSLGRDSLLATVCILSCLQEANMDLEALMEQFPKTYFDKRSFSREEISIENLKLNFNKLYPDCVIDERDGLYMATTSGLPWLHVRHSNTEPVVRYFAEAKNDRILKSLFTL